MTNWPLLAWYHIAYDVIGEGVHFHEQGCSEYPGLRFIWTLDTQTNERRSRFRVRNSRIDYDDLNEAIEVYIEKYGIPKKRRHRVRL